MTEKNISGVSAGKSKITIKWLGQWHGEGKKEQLIRETAREFTFLHQNIEIDLEFPYQMAKLKADAAISSDVTKDTIIKMIVKNQWPYDLMVCDAFIYEKVGKELKLSDWGKEYLVNFKDEPWFIKAHKQGLFDNNRYTAIFGGIAPGGYIEGMWNILYVSADVEKRLGINVKRQDMNMSDFQSYASAVYKYNQSHSDKITFFKYPLENNIMPFFNQIAMSALGKDSPASREDAIDALRQSYAALEKLVPYKPLESYVTLPNERSLIHDKILFILYPSWINMLWQKSNPEGEKVMHPCEMPSLDNKNATNYSGIYNCTFVVPKNAKHRKEAEMLMEFIASPETAGKWTKYSKSPTGLRNRISYGDFGTDEYTKFSQHISKKYHDKLLTIDMSSMFLKTNKTLNFQVENVLNGKISANEAVKNIIRQTQ
jgi:ABC-type glycerol-3-phosphate transport system substrate-binding protein